MTSSSSSSESDAGPPAKLPQQHGGGAVRSAASEGVTLRVSYSARKARVCLLCSAKSTDESPLEYGDEQHMETSGRIPWRSYEKVQEEGDMVRAPSGKLDLMGFNVYRALGHSYCLIFYFHFFIEVLSTLGTTLLQLQVWTRSTRRWTTTTNMFPKGPTSKSAKAS